MPISYLCPELQLSSICHLQDGLGSKMARSPTSYFIYDIEEELGQCRIYVPNYSLVRSAVYLRPAALKRVGTHRHIRRPAMPVAPPIHLYWYYLMTPTTVTAVCSLAVMK